MEANDALFSLWPVPSKSIDVGTRFGLIHINVSGPEDAPPLVLLHAAGFCSIAWFANVGALSRDGRTFAWYVKLNLGLARRMIRPSARSQLKISAAKGAVLEELFIDVMEIVNKDCLLVTVVPTVYRDDELKRITIPTLLLIGDAEEICNPEKAIKRARRLMYDLTAETIPLCRHLLIMEQLELMSNRIVESLYD